MEKVNINWGCFVAVVIFDDDKMSQRIELTPKVIKCLVSSVASLLFYFILFCVFVSARATFSVLDSLPPSHYTHLFVCVCAPTTDVWLLLRILSLYFKLIIILDLWLHESRSHIIFFSLLVLIMMICIRVYCSCVCCIDIAKKSSFSGTHSN